MLPFAIPYPPEQSEGFWGKPTSTIDWCEENYVVSPYIAEAINTTTNAIFVSLALFYIYQSHVNRLGFRFVLTGFGFCLVGVGSWLFHMTLRYECQLLDELPMIYTTCIPFWSVYTEFRSTRYKVIMAVAVVTAAAALTGTYMYIIQTPTFHQVTYALLNFSIIYKAKSLANAHVHDATAKRALDRSTVQGIGYFVLGYLLWNLDIHLCSSVRQVRRDWGMPYGFILEGHGWWHIFTGTGVYFCVIYLQYLKCFLEGTQEFYKFTTFYGLSVVKLVDEPGLLRYKSVQKLAQADEDFRKNESKKNQ